MKKPIKIKVFKSGLHKTSKGLEFNATDELLQTIVNNYNKQVEDEKHFAPLRPIAHNNYKAGYSAGFTDKLEFDNGELYAYVYPSKQLVEDVRDNKLGTVSIGLTKSGDNLDHIAILGSVNPAIKGLGLLQFSEESFLHFSEDETKHFNLITFNEAIIMPPGLTALRDAIVAAVSQEYGTEVGTKINAIFEELYPQFAAQINAPAQPAQPATPPAPTPTPPQFSESPEYKKLLAETQELKRQNLDLQFSQFTKENLIRIMPKNVELAKELMHIVSEKETTNFSENGTALDGLGVFKKFVSNLKPIVELGSGKFEFSEDENNKPVDGVAIAEEYNKKRGRTK